MKRRIASMYRNANDTVRIHIYDRVDVGAECPRGQQYDADVFVRLPKPDIFRNAKECNDIVMESNRVRRSGRP